MITTVSVVMALAAGPATTTELAHTLGTTPDVVDDLLGQIHDVGAASKIGEPWYLNCSAPEAISRLITRATQPGP